MPSFVVSVLVEAPLRFGLGRDVDAVPPTTAAGRVAPASMPAPAMRTLRREVAPTDFFFNIGSLLSAAFRSRRVPVGVVVANDHQLLSGKGLRAIQPHAARLIEWRENGTGLLRSRSGCRCRESKRFDTSGANLIADGPPGLPARHAT